MSTNKPIIVVFGATGYQGGSVIKYLLKEGKYTIRAVSRNPQSAASVNLSKQGVEVVQGDANDAASLTPVFAGAAAAFLVTNFWDPTAQLNPETDLIQGKKLVDAVVASKSVKFVVWSSLHDIDEASNNTLSVPHFTSKAKVEQYIRQQTSIQAAFVYPGFYVQNWINFPPFGVPAVIEGKTVLATAVRPDVALPLIDVEEDFGKFVVPLFSSPSQYNGARIMAATEYLTVPQMAHVYEQISGDTVTIKRIPVSAVPIPELQATINLFNKYGYYDGELIEPTLQQYSNVKFQSFGDWIKRVNYKPKSQ